MLLVVSVHIGSPSFLFVFVSFGVIWFDDFALLDLLISGVPIIGSCTHIHCLNTRATKAACAIITKSSFSEWGFPLG